MLSLPDYPVRQRDFLLEISRAITSRLELGEVLRRVLHASVVMTAARVGLIALANENDNEFQIRAFTGIQRENAHVVNEKLREIMANVTEAGMEYQYLNDRLAELAASIDEGLRQAVAMPLVFDKKPLGLLIVFRSYTAEVSRNDMAMLYSFADQASIAVHNAQLYERINNERQRLSAILDHSGDGVMILDANLEILQVNRAFEAITAWSSEDAVGLSQNDVIVWKHIDRDDLRDALAAGWPYKSKTSSETLYVEGDIERRDGMSLSIGISYAPLYSGDGKLSTIIANIRDITNFRRAQEMQNIFISTVSHELRTPVAIIKGYASTLARPDAQWQMSTIKDNLLVIEEEADRLTELIDDLLTASRIQAERSIRLNMADVSLDQLAQSSVERFGTQSSRHKFSLSFQEDFPAVQADAKLMRQVIDNLITNAIKYSPNGGTITIGGRYNEEDVTLFVRDEGAGIAENDLPRIFERFFRVESSLTSKTKGTGLGLYLVKTIIEAHKGRIQVKSQLGHGSTFYFTIPRD
jgi:PAS domain S-box-containing protein